MRADPRFELAAPPALNLVCFRLRDGAGAGDEANQAMMERVNAAGRYYLSHTRIGGRYTLRLSVGQSDTEERHVEGVWRALQDAAG